MGGVDVARVEGERSPRQTTTTAQFGVPAKAGTHRSASEPVDRWIPAFAGTPVFPNSLLRSPAPAFPFGRAVRASGKAPAAGRTAGWPVRPAGAARRGR